MRPIRIKLAPTTASATAISASASPGAGAIVLTALAAGPIDPQAGTPFGLGRIVSLVSGSDDSGITFTITGVDQNGVTATEAVVGGNTATVVSTKYYTSISSVTHTGSVAGTFSMGIVGTTASAALGMLPLDLYARIGATVAVTVSGTISYTVSLTYDDVLGGTVLLANCALFATPATPTALTAQSASKYSLLPPGVCGVDVKIPTYSTSGFIIVNIVTPANSNCG